MHARPGSPRSGAVVRRGARWARLRPLTGVPTSLLKSGAASGAECVPVRENGEFGGWGVALEVAVSPPWLAGGSALCPREAQSCPGPASIFNCMSRHGPPERQHRGFVCKANSEPPPHSFPAPPPLGSQKPSLSRGRVPSGWTGHSAPAARTDRGVTSVHARIPDCVAFFWLGCKGGDLMGDDESLLGMPTMCQA